MPTTDSVHLRFFRARAKSLHKAVRTAEPEGLARIKPYFNDPTTFKLTQAQLVVAREANLKSWRELIGKEDWMSCSFCKKWQYELDKLIAGPDRVFVCDGCVELCNEIIRQSNQTS